MIYVPDKNYQCFVVQNENVIRAYKTVPRNNSTINYRDYYIHSDYIFQDGSQSFSQYSTLPVCLSSSEITDNWFYRLDLPDILISFTIICLFIFYIPYKIFSRFFGRWLKL